MKSKSFVLDTNILIHRPDAFLSFRDCEVIIPLSVFEELDKLKRDHAGRGRSARQAIRYVNEYSKHGNLQKGIKLPSGSILKVGLPHKVQIPPSLAMDNEDNQIILCALSLKQDDRDVFFVSKDINARIKAAVLGLRAVDYEKNNVNIERLYTGFVDLSKEFPSIDGETQEKILDPSHTYWNNKSYNPQEFLLLGTEKPTHPFPILRVLRWDEGEKKLQPVPPLLSPIMGIEPLNFQQRMAFDLLLDDDVSLVTMVGQAGTGKTLLVLAAALQKTLEKKAYSRILVSRPIISMGRDLGYLPGQKQAKMSHWMQPVFDNLEYILESTRQQNFKSINQLINDKIIEIEALTYIRGRSLPKQFIIIDEAQNLTPHEVKTIVSRAGDGTKVVLTGDPNQIDSPYLDAESNGLTYLVEKFKEQSLAGHITLTKTERSSLAELAAELL